MKIFLTLSFLIFSSISFAQDTYLDNFMSTVEGYCSSSGIQKINPTSSNLKKLFKKKRNDFKSGAQTYLSDYDIYYTKTYKSSNYRKIMKSLYVHMDVYCSMNTEEDVKKAVNEIKQKFSEGKVEGIIHLYSDWHDTYDFAIIMKDGSYVSLYIGT